MILSLIYLLIYLVIVGIVAWVFYYVIDVFNIPQPLNKVLKLAIVVICCLVVILLLLQFVGVVVPLHVPAA